MDIPEDVRLAAMGALMSPEHEMVDSVARAILAERKRCVEAVHRAAKDFYGNPDQMYAAARIATSIESGQ